MARREKGGEHGSLQRSFQVKAKRKVAAKGEAWAGQLRCVYLFYLFAFRGRMCKPMCRGRGGSVAGQVKMKSKETERWGGRAACRSRWAVSSSEETLFFLLSQQVRRNGCGKSRRNCAGETIWEVSRAVVKWGDRSSAVERDWSLTGLGGGGNGTKKNPGGPSWVCVELARWAAFSRHPLLWETQREGGSLLPLPSAPPAESFPVWGKTSGLFES